MAVTRRSRTSAPHPFFYTGGCPAGFIRGVPAPGPTKVGGDSRRKSGAVTSRFVLFGAERDDIAHWSAGHSAESPGHQLLHPAETRPPAVRGLYKQDTHGFP